MISRPLASGPGIPSSGPLSAFPVLSEEGRLSPSRPLGCMVEWFRGRLFWIASQAVRGPAWGDSPGSRTGREGAGERVWEGLLGGRSGWPPPRGAGPTANSAPTVGTSSAGFVQRRASQGWPKETTCQRSLQEVPRAQPSCLGSSSTDVVSKGEAKNPSLLWFATSWALSEWAGVAAAPRLFSSHFRPGLKACTHWRVMAVLCESWVPPASL